MPRKAVDYLCSRCGKPTRRGRRARGMCQACYERWNKRRPRLVKWLAKVLREVGLG